MATTPHTQEPSPEQALEALMLDGDLERLEDQLAEFNLFDVLGVWHRELQHSWLLDPRESHGLGDYFLRAFLSQAAKEARARGIPVPTPFDIDGWALADVEVARERHRIDVLGVSEADYRALASDGCLIRGHGRRSARANPPAEGATRRLRKRAVLWPGL